VTRACLATLALVACSSAGAGNAEPTAAGGAGANAHAGAAGSGGNREGAGGFGAAAGSAAGGNANRGGSDSGGSSTGGAPGSAGTFAMSGTNAGGQSAGTGGGASGAAGAAGGGASATVGTIVPLYTDPSDESWTAIVSAKQAHAAVQVVAIVNPDSGPGARIDASYTTGIARLVAAGIVPIGYVSTAYTARGEPAVKADIDSWHAFYPSLAGIFFDEQSNQAGDDGFYRDVSAYAKGQGLSFTVGNPGTNVPASDLGALDVMLIYESKGLPKLTSLSGYRAERAHYGIIPYGAQLDAAFIASAKADVAYVYTTSDDLPNPWDTLTPYFGQLLDALSP
jgi:hypothetical protein